MTPECSNDVSWMSMHHLEKAVGGIAECAWAGPGHPLHVKGENLNDTVRRVMPDADWVIIQERGLTRFKNAVKIPPVRDCRIAYSTSDIHWNPEMILKRLNGGNWDAFLMLATRTALGIYVNPKGERKMEPVDPDYYLKHLNAPVFYLAPSVNPQIFKPLDEPKTHDVAFLGDHHRRYYPLRADIWGGLPGLAERSGWRALIRGVPPGRSFVSRNIDKLLEQGYIVGSKYAEALARSRAFIFGTSLFKYAGKKLVEGMSCGACCLSDTPLSAEELHYVADWNYVEIGMGNWAERLSHYLRHEEQREEIARNGYDTAVKYHTSDVRAAQLVKFLEEQS